MTNETIHQNIVNKIKFSSDYYYNLLIETKHLYSSAPLRFKLFTRLTRLK